MAEEEAKPKPPPFAPPGLLAPLIVIQTPAESLDENESREATTDETPEQIYEHAYTGETTCRRLKINKKILAQQDYNELQAVR